MEAPAREIRQEKEIKHTHIEEKEVKLSLFIDNKDVICRKSFNIHNILELVNKFSKLAGYMINMQILYTLAINNVKSKFKKFHLQ